MAMRLPNGMALFDHLGGVLGMQELLVCSLHPIPFVRVPQPPFPPARVE